MGHLGELQTTIAMCVFPSNVMGTRIFIISLKRCSSRTDSHSQDKYTSLTSSISVTQAFPPEESSCSNTDIAKLVASH